MRVLSSFLLILCIIIAISAPAKAGEGGIIYCGDPKAADLTTDPKLDFCDIYARRFAYAGEDIKFRQMLRDRQANYAAPRDHAFNAYRQELDSRHGGLASGSAAR